MSADNGYVEHISNLEKYGGILLELKAVKNKNASLKLQVDELLLCSDDIYDTVYNLENQLNELNQYSRCENIEFQNIPESVEQKDLVTFVIQLFKSITVEVSSYNLVAAHRLGKQSLHGNRSLIVRFLNRKTVYSCLRNEKF